MKLQDDVTPFPFAEVEQVIREELGAPDREAVHEFSRRSRSRPRRSARCTGRCSRTAGGSRSRCSARTRRGRSRPTSRCSTRRRRSRRSACGRSTSSTRASSSTSSPARSGRSSTTGSEARNAQAFHRNFAGHPHVRIPHVYWSYSRAARAHARVARGQQLADVEPQEYTLDERRRPRVPDDRGVDDDDLPARLLPRRPAPGEHPRARPTDRIGLVDFGQAGKLSDDDMSKLTRAVHRRGRARTSTRLRGGSATSASATSESREAEFVGEIRELYYRYYGARLSEIDPLQVIREAFAADLLA